MDSNNSQIAMVVPSCDVYADVWEPLFQALIKYWPNINCPKYLVTNHMAPTFPGVSVICVGDDISWSGNLLFALERVTERYVLLNIDDLILCAPVDHQAVDDLTSKFVKADGHYLRLNPTPRGLPFLPDIDIVPPGDMYRSSTVFSLWRKDVLKSVLEQGESAWHFEIRGSSRTDKYREWFATRRFMLNYVNLVVKGKIDPRALAVIERCGITYQSVRSKMTHAELARLRLKERRSRIFNLLPRRWRRSIRNLFLPV